MPHLCRPAAQFLSQSDGHGVHEVCAPGLDLALELGGAPFEGVGQMLQCRQQAIAHPESRTDMDGGGDHVVAALAAVDMIVGVYGPAQACAGQAGDHLVGVHVGAGARTGLEDIDGELRVMVAGLHFGGGGHDGVGQVGRQASQVPVDAGRAGLDQPQRGDERTGHGQTADGEVVHRPLGLGAVKGVRWYPHLPHAVTFDALVVFCGHSALPVLACLYLGQSYRLATDPSQGACGPAHTRHAPLPRPPSGRAGRRAPVQGECVCAAGQGNRAGPHHRGLCRRRRVRSLGVWVKDTRPRRGMRVGRYGGIGAGAQGVHWKRRGRRLHP